jgi:hypothetical protein
MVGSFPKPDATVKELYFKLNEDIEMLVDVAVELAFKPLEIHVLVEK